MENNRILAFLSVLITSTWTNTDGEEYIIAIVESNRVDAIFGEVPGWLQLQSEPIERFVSNSKNNFPTDQSLVVTSGIENKTFLFRTSDTDPNIFSYHDYMQFSPLPISALGTKYIVSSCHPPGNYTSILVIATHSQKTAVDLRFRLEGTVVYNGKTYSDNDTLTLMLDYNKTFTLRSKFDLSGSVIGTSNTVAVFSGTLYQEATQWIKVVAFEQLLPVEHHGQEYVVSVDDDPALYQLQIVCEDMHTEIMINNGTTVSLGESRVYRQFLNLNESISFTSTKPVMTTLCREAEMRSGSLVVPPVSSYRKRSGVYLHPNETLKVLTEQEIVVQARTVPVSSYVEEWRDIPGTRFQVGTYFSEGSSSYYISTGNGTFATLVYRSFYIYNGGYNLSSHVLLTTPSTLPDTEGDKTIIGVVAAGTGVSATAAMMYSGYVLFRRRRKRRSDTEEERNDEEERKKKRFDPKDRPPHPPPGGDPPLVRM